MPRLLVHVEGETEETFINEVLAPHLYRVGYESVSARIIGHARHRNRRGGIRGWNSVRKDIINHLREDQSCIATTMVDYYALPHNGERAWPGRLEAGGRPFTRKAVCVQKALLRDILSDMGDDFNHERFIPFIVMHEFEGLLFSDCTGFARGIGQPGLTPQFQAIRDQFATPEEINDSPATCPSKRVEALVRGYQKPLLGNLAALEIGLDNIRSQCPHFADWLKRLGA